MKCVVNVDARGFVAAERALHLASTPYSTSRGSINNGLTLASNPSPHSAILVMNFTPNPTTKAMRTLARTGTAGSVVATRLFLDPRCLDRLVA